MSENQPGTGFDPFYNGLVLPALQTQPPQIPDERVLRPLAGHLWGNGRISEALTCLRLLKMRAPLDVPCGVMQGYWQLYEGQSALARDSFAAALEREPANQGARLGQAFALFYLEDYAAAARLFRELADQAAPLPSAAVMARASEALVVGRKPDMVNIAPLPGLPRGMAETMQIRILEGVAAAIARAQSLIEKGLGDSLPLQRLILEWHLELGRDRAAAALSDDLTKAYPEDGPLSFFRGIALRRAGRKDESHDAFVTAAYLLAPLEARAWGATAAGQVERNELDHAASNYRVALFLDESDRHFWGDFGQIELVQGRHQSAHHAFSKAIDLGARTFINFFFRGLCSLYLQHDLESVKDWARAMQVDPRHPKVPDILDMVARRAAPQSDQRFVFGIAS
jgi:tetratricopeptide (TPR) repeat protein